MYILQIIPECIQRWVLNVGELTGSPGSASKYEASPLSPLGPGNP